MTKIKLFRLFVVFVFMSATKFYAQSTITRPYETGYFCSVFMSSPVVGQNIGDTYKHLDNGGLSGNTFIPSLSYNQSRWNPVTGQWITINRATIMQPGVGYVETTPPIGVGNYSAIAFELPYNQSYTGNFTVNDGDITVPIVVGVSSFNLIGNPYPDFLDADSFLLDPDNTNISGTIFLWTHNTVSSNLTPGIYQSNFTPSDYAMYNLLGGVAAGRSTSSVAGSNQVATSTVEVKKPNGKIYMGTAFFVRAINGGGTIKFKNDMRIATIPTTPQYFRSENEQRIATPPARNRIWINLEQSNGTPATSPLSQTLIGYVAGATTGENDRCFDNGTFVFTINPKVNIYSLADINSPKKLAIQGRDILPTFDVSDKFKLGFTGLVPLNTTQTFTITAEGDGLFAAGGQPYYLKDNLTGQIVSFPYTFTLNSDEINNNGRFEVVFSSCIVNVASLVSQVNTPAISGATSYIWTVTNLNTNQNLPSISTSLSVLNLNNTNIPIGFIKYNNSYALNAVAIVNGIPQPSTPFCVITTNNPTTQLSNCSGYVLPTINSPVTATSIPSLSQYKWEIVNMSNMQTFQLTTPLSTFRFSDVYPWPVGFIQYDTEYCVKVKGVNIGLLDNLSFQTTSCCFRTPTIPVTQITNSFCNQIIPNSNPVTYVKAIPVVAQTPFATKYRFKLSKPFLNDLIYTNPTVNIAQFHLIAANFIDPLGVNTLQPSTQYNVSVAIIINGIQGAYGPECPITTASTLSKTMPSTEMDLLLKSYQSVTAYPNPFTKSFSLNLESSINEEVTIKVYDVLGKLLEDKQVNLSISKNIEIGGNYQTGIYNVVVFDGDLVKATRVIKN